MGTTEVFKEGEQIDFGKWVHMRKHLELKL